MLKNQDQSSLTPASIKNIILKYSGSCRKNYEGKGVYVVGLEVDDRDSVRRIVDFNSRRSSGKCYGGNRNIGRIVGSGC